MFNSRKGVSEVVANVLIVLLVIVGIAVIWSVVKPTIDKSAEGIQSDCFTVQVEPVSCTGFNPTTGVANVLVKRNAGSGEMENIELLFEDASGNSRRVTPQPAVTLGELETRTIPVTTATGLSGAVTVNTVLRSGGQLCQVTTQPVDC